MDKPRRFADVFREIRRKSDNVVVSSFFDFADALNRKSGFRLDFFNRIVWNRSVFGVNFANGDFHIKPFLKPILFRPNRAHFGQCVSLNHKGVILTQRRKDAKTQRKKVNCR